MITKGTKLFNIDKLTCAIIKCAVDDYKASFREETRFQGKGENIDHTAEYFLSRNILSFLQI